jgi:hypothetical protein
VRGLPPRVQIKAESDEGIPGKSASENLPYHHRLAGVDVNTFLVKIMPEHEPQIDQLATFKPIANPPFLVFASGEAFF